MYLKTNWDQFRKKKREGFVVPYGTDLLLEPYGFATIQFFYNANHKNQLPYGSGLLLLPEQIRDSRDFLKEINKYALLF